MEAFDNLEDPRRRASCAYGLDELLLTALCAVTSGADDWVSVALWGQEKLEWLKRFLPFEQGVVSHDIFSQVFALIDARSFEACFVDWMSRLYPDLRTQAIHIDGKSLRGSHEAGVGMAHLVSAWDSATGVTLGQIRTAGKSNEITAIPQLLDMLDVRGATVTVDAMGCQREVVHQIVERGADYIVAVKNNEPTLAQAVESPFGDEAQGVSQGRLQQDTTTEKNHGRLETRRCVVAEVSGLSSALHEARPGHHPSADLAGASACHTGRDCGSFAVVRNGGWLHAIGLLPFLTTFRSTTKLGGHAEGICGCRPQIAFSEPRATAHEPAARPVAAVKYPEMNNPYAQVTRGIRHGHRNARW